MASVKMPIEINLPDNWAEIVAEKLKESGDYVPVVRCKDCKHYNVFRLECHNKYFNGWIGIDGFCSYGEREAHV